MKGKAFTMDLFQIDKKMVSHTVIEKDGLVFYSPESECIRLFGVQKAEGRYCRLDPKKFIIRLKKGAVYFPTAPYYFNFTS